MKNIIAGIFLASMLSTSAMADINVTCDGGLKLRNLCDIGQEISWHGEQFSAISKCEQGKNPLGDETFHLAISNSERSYDLLYTRTSQFDNSGVATTVGLQGYSVTQLCK